MGKLHWYKRDPVAALEGMSNLSLEERGAYDTVLDLIYARDGQVDDDDRFIAGWCRCDVRVWKRIRATLIRLGKLYAIDGTLRNSRADVEVDRGLHMVASASDAGTASARKRSVAASNNNKIAPTVVEQTSQLSTTTTTTTEENKKEESSLRSAYSVSRETISDGWPKDFREQFWQRYPRKQGRKTAIAKLEGVRKRGEVTFAVLMAGIAKIPINEPQFIPHPATWLNRGGWDDEPLPLGAGSNGSSRRLQDVSLSVSRALERQLSSGGFTIPPRPSLLSKSGDGDLQLLPPRRSAEP
jgi:uncharacterized protein YdaU (DUF1376 family)